MGRPAWHPTRPRVAPRIRRDVDGRLWLRVRGVDRYGRRFDSWQKATIQPGAVPRREAEDRARVELLDATRAREEGTTLTARLLTVSELAEDLLRSAGARASTDRQFRVRAKHWTPVFGHLTPDCVAPDMIRDWWSSLCESDLSVSYTNGVLRDVRRIFRAATAEHLIEKDPVVASRVKGRKDTRGQRTHLLDGETLAPVFAWWMHRDMRAWTAFTLLLATAMRPHELLGSQRGADVGPLLWNDVDDGQFWIDGERSKNWVARAIPVSTFVGEVLAMWRQMTGADDDEPIVALSRDLLSSRWREALSACGMTPGRKGVGVLYSLRALGESVMDRHGVPDSVADQVTGHKTSAGATVIRRAYDLPFTGEAANAAEVLGEHARQHVGWPRFGAPVPRERGTEWGTVHGK